MRSLGHSVCLCLLALVVYATGCSDVGVQSYNTPPEISLIGAPDGVEVVQGAAFAVEALAQDNEDAPEALQVFLATGGGVLDEAIPDEDGQVDFSMPTDSLPLPVMGDHEVSLTVVDTDGASATVSFSLVVIAVDVPQVEIVTPLSGAEVCSEETVQLEGLADDPDGEESDLTARWESDLDGVLADDLVVGADGSVAAAVQFSHVGDHALSLTVTDLDGNEGRDEVIITVLSLEQCNVPPTATIEAPVSGTGFTTGTCIEFLGTVADDEDLSTDLTLSWTSSVDGELDASPPDSLGSTTFLVCGLSAADHYVTLEVQDSLGGVGQASVHVPVCEDLDGDGEGACAGDCDDADPWVHEGAAELCDGVDTDCDGWVDPTEMDGDGDGYPPCAGDCDDADPDLDPADVDGDGMSSCAGDCDDGAAATYLGASEICDGADNDCDGTVPADETDGDGDGQRVCGGDCDDSAPDVGLGFAELCDGIDNDCDGAAEGETDDDGDGFPECGGDCDDAEVATYPGATEVCDGADNDCDGSIPADEADADGDGQRICAGDCDDTLATVGLGFPEVCDGLDSDCDGLPGADETDLDGDLHLACGGDCDDADSSVHPEAVETCDGVLDNDCDGRNDPAETDDDGDGQTECDGDCDDTRTDRHAGNAEICDMVDNDCDGQLGYDEVDWDGDGYSGCDGDCGPEDDWVYPGAPDVCDDVADNDCDGVTDPLEADDDADGASDCDGDCDDDDPTLNLRDDDLDGYTSCSDDCDDTDPATHPDAEEVCDDVPDNDCDGVDDPLEIDDDGDGFTECSGDCNDLNEDSHPAAEEICDGLDNDCDGSLPPDEEDADGDWQKVCEGDCDDHDPLVGLGFPELCDRIDNDCNGLGLDEEDLDGDGYTPCEGDCDDHDPAVYIGAPEVCDGVDDNDCDDENDPLEIDDDGDGFTECSGDCDDLDEDSYPAAMELCDGMDNDCDDSLPADEADGDADEQMICEGDCDDDDPLVGRGFPELCDRIDNNCDGLDTEEEDIDGDGYTPCEGDCDDDEPAAHPGAAEVCDGVADNDCDGDDDPLDIDDDGDGYSECVGDCDDEDAAVFPGAPDVCDAVLDNDCDGVTDPMEDDGDGDGWTECEGDCNDGDADLNLDDLDQDGWDTCDGDCDDDDEDLNLDDMDGDGWDTCEGDCDDGDADLNLEDLDGDGWDTCEGDCDDGNAAFNPAAVELCGDAVDNDCDTAADCSDEDCTTDPVCNGYVLAPSGTFTMGSPVEEVGRFSNEDQHQVTLTRGFYIGETVVTQLDFETVLGWNPSQCNWGCGDDYPAQYLTWYDAVAYANVVSANDGLTPCYDLSSVECWDGSNVGASYWECLNATRGGIHGADVALNGIATPYVCEGYRLPTEAEWEYAARAGETAAFPNGGNLYAGDDVNCGGNLLLDNGTYLDDIAWYCGNENGATEPVGSLHPNTWGLYDTSGNVLEWVWDWSANYDGNVFDPTGPASGTHRVKRGNFWGMTPAFARAANRGYANPDDRTMFLGFRLARSSP